MSKAPTKTNVSLRLDRVERDICLHLAGYKCMSTGSTEKLQWCHIVKRGRKSLRWDRRNSLILSSSEHYRFDNMMTDRQRYRFVNKLKEQQGFYNVYDYLDIQILLKFELSLADMLVLLAQKKEELAELKGNK